MNKSHLYWVLPFVLLGCKDSTQSAESVTAAPVAAGADHIASIEVSNPSTFARPDQFDQLRLFGTRRSDGRHDFRLAEAFFQRRVFGHGYFVRGRCGVKIV